MMHSFLSSAWGGDGTPSVRPRLPDISDNPSPPLPAWDGVENLIDQTQVSLFDAFHKLSRLRSDRNIAAPQLIVVGEQSSGKSSLLEAIARFPFPVHGGLCTRFPIKLVLRRSSEIQIRYFIEPGSSRSNEDRDRLGLFGGQLANTGMFGECMTQAAAFLGVPAPPGYEGLRDDKRRSQGAVAGFTDDILVVHQSGPHLPHLDVVDLPGIFQASSHEQSGADRTIVMNMVEKYIKDEGNLVLLVAHAGNSYNNSGAVQIVQSILNRDPDLARRVVGVLTHPEFADDLDSLEQAREVLLGRKDSTIPRWHVVKNWGRTEANRMPLQERDGLEEVWFVNPANGWHDIPPENRGTGALRIVLKSMISEHIQTMLPKLVDRLVQEISALQDRLDVNGTMRVDDPGRRTYLRGIAQAIEYFATQACQGTYINPTCWKPHLRTVSCRTCDGFFGKFGKETQDDQDKNLRANIKALSTLFASRLHESGRTRRVKDTGESAMSLQAMVGDLVDKVIVPNPSQTQQQATTDGGSTMSGRVKDTVQAKIDILRTAVVSSAEKTRTGGFIPESVRDRYYKHPKSELTTRGGLENFVSERLERWSGGDAPGETNPVVFSGLSEWQSQKWVDIASSHLDAVWHAVRRFVDLALAQACEDKDVRKALREYLILPSLNRMEEVSHGDLRRLLACHSKNSMWFSHAFVDLVRLRRQNDQLATAKTGGSDPVITDQLLTLTKDTVTKELTDKGISTDAIASAVGTSLTVIFGAGGLATKFIAPFIGAGLGALSAAGSSPGHDSTASSRLILQEEGCYEMSMIAFVGYVNTWVVGQGILDRLPTEILTHRIVDEMSKEMVEKIAGQAEAVAAQYARDKVDLQTMNEVLETMKKHMRN